MSLIYWTTSGKRDRSEPEGEVRLTKVSAGESRQVVGVAPEEVKGMSRAVGLA